MPMEQEALRDWHRLFGLLLTDFFTDSPFIVEVERDLSQQQQLLDVVIVRRGQGQFAGRLPDGLEGLTDHNLISFKSHHESLDAWAMKELVGHSVAYRKFVSLTTSELLPEEMFRLYAICARYPRNLAGQVPWHQLQAGVYNCQWGTDIIRVIVVGELSQETHNAPLHLFSATAELVGFGSVTYRRRSKTTSALLEQLFKRFQGEGFTMAFTMEDFQRQYVKDHFERLTPLDVRDLLQSMPHEKRETALRAMTPEQLLTVFSEEELRLYLDKLSAKRPTKPRRKK